MFQDYVIRGSQSRHSWCHLFSMLGLFSDIIELIVIESTKASKKKANLPVC
jgi:hypothetical protein